MRNVLIINGHESYDSSQGRLNRTMSDHMARRLGETREVRSTVLQEGYNVQEEQEKYLWADVILYQTPIYWFSVPGLFKTYMDRVFAYGVFFQGSPEYGRGGLLAGKSYLFSTTWNAPAYAFDNPDRFFAGRGLEDALRHLHDAHAFLGMRALPSFACFDVIKNPDLPLFLTRLDTHLDQVLQDL